MESCLLAGYISCFAATSETDLPILHPPIKHTCTGYGLPIARNYSRYFGGDIEIFNRPGQGCNVVVTLSQLGETKERFV